MKEIRFNVIKETEIDLPILAECLTSLPRVSGFKGSTHAEYRVHGTTEAAKAGQNFGYNRAKDGADYWVLPHFYDPALDVVRKEGEEIVSILMDEEQLINFGFDVIEELE